MNKMLASLEQRLSDKNEVKVLSAAPYIITIDNFLSDKEIDSVLSSLTGWEVPKLKGGDPDEEENLDVHKARAPYVDWCDDKCLEVT